MTLLELMQLLRKHLALVIALPVAFAFVAAVYCWGFMADTYTATVSIIALNQTEASENYSGSTLNSDLSAGQMLANDLAKLAADKQLQQNCADQLGMENLAAYDISVNSSTTTRVMSVEVTGNKPTECAVIANKLAEVLDVTAREVMEVKAVNVVSEAQTPDKPSGPKRAMYTMVALLAGLFLAIAIVVLMDMLNTAVKDDEDIRAITGVPVIGRFPNVK